MTMADDSAAAGAGRVHWVRVLVGGLLAEALLIVLVIPIALKWGQHPLLWVAPVGSLLTCFVFGMWVGRGVQSRFVVHGLLVGVVAAVIYVALTLARPEPMAYVIAHGLKLLGGMAGGWVARRQRGNRGGV
jgi:putative membrane protein (TIGR04086 family)